MNAVSIPTGHSDASSAAPPLTVGASRAPAMVQLLEDGIYLLFLLKNDAAPHTFVEFDRRLGDFLARFERNARQLGKDAEAIALSKYAFCALMDEVILASDFPLREEWERSPLQLRLFGDHLAGERFFDKLELLRLDPVRSLETLEVFHICLLLGFSGKYLLEGPEKLQFLVARVGQEITNARGGPAPFAPHWKPPHRIQQYVRAELPLWLFFGLLAIASASVFGVYAWLLDGHTGALTLQQHAEPSPYETAPRGIEPPPAPQQQQQSKPDTAAARSGSTT